MALASMKISAAPSAAGIVIMSNTAYGDGAEGATSHNQPCPSSSQMPAVTIEATPIVAMIRQGSELAMGAARHTYEDASTGRQSSSPQSATAHQSPSWPPAHQNGSTPSAAPMGGHSRRKTLRRRSSART